jgi:hypothetical protein
MKVKQTKSSPTTAISKFVSNFLKAMFQPTTNADFNRLKNFIC